MVESGVDIVKSGVDFAMELVESLLHTVESLVGLVEPLPDVGKLACEVFILGTAGPDKVVPQDQMVCRTRRRP